MRKIFIVLFVTNFVSAQVSKQKDIIYNILQESVIPDFCYYLSLEETDKTKKTIFYFSPQNFKFNSKTFDIKQINIDFSKNDNLFLEDNKIEKAMFVVFNTEIIDQRIIVLEVYYKREQFFNIPNDSEYEYWRKMNSGMSYYFEFDSNFSLISFQKKWFSYD